VVDVVVVRHRPIEFGEDHAVYVLQPDLVRYLDHPMVLDIRPRPRPAPVVFHDESGHDLLEDAHW
jgi:hypothetical protein